MRKQSFAEQGQSLVEVALIIPALLILFMGIAEVGFYLYAQVQVANAAREGARYGSLCKQNDTCATLTTEVESAVLSEAELLKMDGTNTSVAVQWSGSVPPTTSTPITVTVAYTHTSPFISNFVPMFPTELPVEHTVVMQFDK